MMSEARTLLISTLVVYILLGGCGKKESSESESTEAASSSNAKSNGPTAAPSSTSNTPPPTAAAIPDVNVFTIYPDGYHLILGRRIRSDDYGDDRYVVEKYQLEPFKKVADVDTDYRVTELSISANGNFICGDGPDKEIRVWDAHTFERVAHFRPETSLMFQTRSRMSADGRVIMTKMDVRQSLIDRVTGETRNISLYRGTTFDAAMAPDREFAYLGTIDLQGTGPAGKLFVYDGFETPLKLAHQLVLPLVDPERMSVSGDGSTLAICGRRGQIVVYDTQTWENKGQWERIPPDPTRKLSGHESLSVSTDGSYLVTKPMYSGRARAEVWDLATGEMKQIGPDAPCNAAYFVNDTIVCYYTRKYGFEFYDVVADKSVPAPAAPLLVDQTPNAPIEVDNLEPVVAMQTLREARQYDEAVSYLSDLDPPENQPGRELSFIEFHREAAQCFRFVGDYESASNHSRLALETAEGQLSRNVPRFESCLAEAADDLLMSGKVDDAIDLFETTRTRVSEEFDEKSYAIAVVDYEFGRFLINIGDWATANQCFARALESYQYEITTPWDEVARCTMWTGATYAEMQEYDLAIPLLVEARQAFVDGYQRWHPLTSESSWRLRDAYNDTQDFENARLIQTQLPSVEELSHDSAQYSWSRRARQLAGSNEGNQAEALSRELKTAIEKKYGPHHRSIASLQATLGRSYLDAGLPELAITYLTDAISRYDQLLGESYGHRSQLIGLLGLANYLDHDRESGIRLSREAIVDREMITLQDHTDALESHYQLANFLSEQFHLEKPQPKFDAQMRQLPTEHRNDPSLPEFDAVIRQMRETIQIGIRLLPDRLKYRYSVRFKTYSHRAFSVAVEHRFERDWVEASAEWAINAKGLASDHIAQQARLAANLDEEGRDVYQRLLDVRQKLAMYGVSNSSYFYVNQSRAAISQLMKDEEELTTELARLMPTPQSSDDWITLQEVREAIPAGNVVVEFLAHHKINASHTGGVVERYVAWIIPAIDEGEVRLIPLGSREEIDTMVRRYHEMIERHRQVGSFATMEEQWQEIYPLTVLLSLRALQPIESAIDPYTRWILCPDGDLWFVPWKGLTSLDGQFVAESRIVTSLYSARALTRKSPDIELTLPMIFGHPDYNAGAPANSNPFPFTPLPGTERETDAIKVPISRIAGESVEPFMNEHAKEAELRNMSKPRILAFSTHGYFDKQNRGMNPLLRCGLALAGANVAYRQAMRASDSFQNEDGILTGIEVTSLDLLGTELVFLNACETGQGAAMGGEGVAGLHHAFHLAGAQQVMSTLWPINDALSADLAINFFNELANDETADQALHLATQELIQRLKDEHGFAHPKYFAPFQLSGVLTNSDTECDLRDSKFLINSIDMPLVRVEPGSFQMGSPNDEAGRGDDEALHDVTLSDVFWIGRFEVTQDEFAAIANRRGSQYHEKGVMKDEIEGMATDRFPVEYISYDDAVYFCEMLSNRPEEKAAGRRYRLPTEAEWEYACRGGNQESFHFGPMLHSFWANMDGRSPTANAPKGPFIKRPAVVGEYPWNPLGIHDMHGNVWEWCLDGYGPYSDHDDVNPMGPQDAPHRVIRGGGFDSEALECRSAKRFHALPTYKATNVGFRVVCEIAN